MVYTFGQSPGPENSSQGEARREASRLDIVLKIRAELELYIRPQMKTARLAVKGGQQF